MASGSTGTPVRRPRTTADREQEILSAALTVLRDVGYEALTMDAVAAAARCSKATLYRLWTTKAVLVAQALYASRPAVPNRIDTGSLRGDLVAFVESMSDRVEVDTPLFAGLAHAALNDPALARALTETLLVHEDQVDAFVDRGVERGELGAMPRAAAFIGPMLFTVIFSRPLFEGAFADADYLVRFVDDVLMPALLHS
jgi:AcrR family transcriptional regulator